MMNVAIIEDDNDIAELLKGYVLKFGEEKGESFDVKVFNDGLDFLHEYKSQYDIILLDIQLPHSNGMAIARKVREVDQTSVIMFITNLPTYAIQGYAVNAVDYILKPVSYENFAFRFKRAVAAIIRADKTRIQVKSDKNVLNINIDDVYYFEIVGHMLIVHEANKDIEVWSSLSAIEKLLPHKQFARCNNCYLVNLKYVKSVNADTVLVGDTALQMSRNRKKGFLYSLSKYA